jgi:hypothetical protein
LGGNKVPETEYEKPDPAKVTKTDPRHPKPQCRLDTYFAGSFCPAPANVDFGKNDPREGACATESGDKEGVRPFCWYAPSARN